MTSPASQSAAEVVFAAIMGTAASQRAELRRAIASFAPRAAVREAGTDNELAARAETLELTVAGWQRLLPDDPAEREALGDLLVERLGAALDHCPRVLEALGRPTAATLVRAEAPGGDTLERAFERIDLPGGEELFKKGDPGDSLYVIARGRLRVMLDEGGDIRLREIGPFQTVGELALLTGDVRQGTVVAVRDSVLYRIDREAFERDALTNSDVTRGMLVTLAERLSRPPRREATTVVPTNIAILPAGPAAPTRAFAAALHRFMAEHATTTLVTSASVEHAVAMGASEAHPASPSGMQVEQHLNALEEGHDHVLLLAEDDSSEWSAKCARSADAILLVAAAGTSPMLNRLELGLFDPARTGSPARLHLVMVEPESTSTPRGTDAWLHARPVELCHHVHLAQRRDLARLARFIVGSPSALVLSGGAARAFAHLGVMSALREAAIPIDIVAGTSAGALVGAQLAMGSSPEDIAHLMTDTFAGSKRGMLDFIPPRTSLIGATRFNTALDRLFGQVRFEDLWIQFVCTTTDLTSAQPRVHRRGLLRPPIRASCSLPMVMPPVNDNGHLLADGGIMNNVPVDPLLEVTSVGFMTVVNVTNPFYTADEAYNYGDSLPLRRVLGSWLNPRAEKLVAPSILDVLMRSLEIGSKSLEPAQVAKADIYVRPDVARFGYTDIDDIDEIVTAGYQEARNCLNRLDPPVIPFSDN